MLWTFSHLFVCGHIFLFLLCIYLGIELLDHMVTLFNLWGIARLFCKATAPFSIPASSVRSFHFVHILVFHILINSCDCYLFGYSHPSGCKGISFWIAFPWGFMMFDHLYMCFLNMCMSLEKSPFRCLDHLKNWVICLFIIEL